MDIKIINLQASAPESITLQSFSTMAIDLSDHDRYLQTIDGRCFRITKMSLDEFEKILPKEHFCRINRYTIISNYENNIQGWSPNSEEVILSSLFIDNGGLYNGTKETEKEYKKELFGKPITFNVGLQYKEKFKEWDKIF